jgi:hypothetical protein
MRKIAKSLFTERIGVLPDCFVGFGLAPTDVEVTDRAIKSAFAEVVSEPQPLDVHRMLYNTLGVKEGHKPVRPILQAPRPLRPSLPPPGVDPALWPGFRNLLEGYVPKIWESLGGGEKPLQ